MPGRGSLWRTVFSIFCLIVTSGIARGDDTDEAIEAWLDRFAADPARVMDESPPRWDESGQPSHAEGLLPRETLVGRRFVMIKDAARAHLMADGAVTEDHIFQEMRGNDRPERLVDPKDLVMTLEQLEADGLKKAALATIPWSGDYWPMAKGVLGQRYRDPNFPNSANWQTNWKYVRAQPAKQLFFAEDPAKLDRLAPSEKYDFLYSTEKTPLTDNMWSEGRSYYQLYGYVEGWFGVCEGWAAAAMMVPKPVKSVTLKAADGKTDIVAHPEDVMGLAALLWARGERSVKWIGGRCHEKNPKKTESGRIISPDCFDTNPGSWHLSVTNQLGRGKRSLLMDATYDYEVWNQPIAAYSYRYFNPRSRIVMADLAQAKLPIGDYTNDPFKEFRSKNATHVVGIAMDVTYVIMRTARESAGRAEPQGEKARTVRYIYDLELDKDGKVIGGEWYMNQHPDFLWLPERDAKAKSRGDGLATGDWNVGEPLPDSWRKGASRAAGASQPLAPMVYKLVKETSEAEE